MYGVGIHMLIETAISLILSHSELLHLLPSSLEKSSLLEVVRS